MDTYLLFFENINKFIEINFFYSLLFFSLYIFFYSAFSLPGLIVFIVFVGYSLGVFWGFLISIIFSTLGSFCFFIISKHILNKFFFKIFSKYTNKIDFYIKKSTFEYLVIFRIIPGPPLMLQNFFFSTLKISNYKFIFSTLIGFLKSCLDTACIIAIFNICWYSLLIIGNNLLSASVSTLKESNSSKNNKLYF